MDRNKVTFKVCTRCQTSKPINEFSPHKTGKFGVAGKCKPCYNVYQQERWQQNPSIKNKRNTTSLKWYQNNKKRFRQNQNRRNFYRYHNDTLYQLRTNLRNLINQALRAKQNVKLDRTEILTGCSFSVLKKHLESKFLPGMNWEDRSLWHIDHIRPIASFDLADPIQQKQAFHYTNLQPLWAKDNMKKGDLWPSIH